MNKDSKISSAIRANTAKQSETHKLTMSYMLDNSHGDIYFARLIFEQTQFDDRVFEDSGNSIFQYHKLQISINDLQYQQQKNNNITQVIEFKSNCNSNTNGYNLSMGINKLSHCLDIELSFTHTNYNGIISINKKYLGQSVYVINLLLISKVLMSLIVLILYNMDGNNFNTTNNRRYELESDDGSSYNANLDTIFIVTSTLVGISDSIGSQENTKTLIMKNFNISQSNDVIVVMEYNIIIIKHAGRLPVNHNLLISFTVFSYNGMILDYIYCFIQILTVISENINWTNNYDVQNNMYSVSIYSNHQYQRNWYC